ncbi:hypothetical protein [Rhodococcus sp. NCIMB 12038]|uniref:hypothetical protein n=1 Tax=Rhodococcus sp. NCIMB 12038 TaxID=933800 RepID=UPI000B55DB72|nr:hypothetical protein [Rhodococcus sp. NCIMB 12038]OUS92850.1 hypothetical protein CA951_26300 [Rhodococcus sp. NCIMB 12038]
MSSNIIDSDPGGGVVVTGAAQGQGAAEALALADAGYIVIAIDIAAKPTFSKHSRMSYRSMDVSRPEEWTALGCVSQ